MKITSCWFCAALVAAIFELTLNANAYAAPTAPLGGVYAPCRSYAASPATHFSAGRATRDTAGHYFAKGSGTELTGTSVTLSETGKAFFEVLNSCPMPTGCMRPTNRPQPLSGLDLICKFTVSGQGTRGYDMHVPNNYTNLWPVPLVMEMHGGGGLAPPPLTEYASRWLDVSDTSSDPFIMIYPIGSTAGTWTPGTDLPLGSGAEWQTCNYDNPAITCPASGFPNDRAFLIEAMKHAAAAVKIDKKRIYATGLSSGAAMVHSLSCKYSQWLAAVAPFADGVRSASQPRARDNYDMTINCNPTRQVPQFYAHSPRDNFVPFAEGVASVAWWRSKFSCTAAPVTILSSEIDNGWDPTDALFPSEDLTVARSTICPNSEVVFVQADGSQTYLLDGAHAVWWGDDFYFETQPWAPRLAQWAWDWMRKFQLPAEPSWPPAP